VVISVVKFGANVFAVGWGVFIGVGVGMFVWMVMQGFGAVRRLLDSE
jgi:hypothetical protein